MAILLVTIFDEFSIDSKGRILNTTGEEKASRGKRIMTKKSAIPTHHSHEAEADQTVPADDRTCLVERPDGFYWQDKPAGKFYGPFPTSTEALLDMQYREDSDYEEGESLHEAEAEIGIADWIDPDTGELAEGSMPHLCD